MALVEESTAYQVTSIEWRSPSQDSPFQKGVKLACTCSILNDDIVVTSFIKERLIDSPEILQMIDDLVVAALAE